MSAECWESNINIQHDSLLQFFFFSLRTSTFFLCLSQNEAD